MFQDFIGDQVVFVIQEEYVELFGVGMLQCGLVIFYQGGLGGDYWLIDDLFMCQVFVECLDEFEFSCCFFVDVFDCDELFYWGCGNVVEIFEMMDQVFGDGFDILVWDGLKQIEFQ